jgi:hypothetical protein
MLEVAFLRVREEKVDALREWMAEIGRREDEALETLRNEGTRHERAYLLECKEGPVLVYALEMEDPERAHRAFRESALPIDAEHKRVMGEVIAGRLQPEELLDLSLPDNG